MQRMIQFRQALGLALSVIVTSCNSDIVAVGEVHSQRDALFANAGFETGDLTSWTATANLSATSPGVTAYPVTEETQLGLRVGGTLRTNLHQGAAPYALIPPGLSVADAPRYPRFGNWAAVVNELGTTSNANRITQSSVITTADVDAADGLVHVRFVMLPSVENAGHTLREQPYSYVTLRNVTRNATLSSRILFRNEEGARWQTNVAGSIAYTDWLFFDFPLSTEQASLGDTISATIIAAGCAQSDHWGQIIIDGFGSALPGLSVFARGPDSVEAGQDFQYQYRISNQGTATATGVRLTTYLPASTTFRSIDTADVHCTSPSVGTRGMVTCALSALPVGATAVVTMTVRADPTATGAIHHGAYSSQSNQEQPLVGPPLTTQLTTGGTTSYVNLITTVDDATSSVTWGQHVAWAITVRNAGNVAAAGALITTAASPSLISLTWACTAQPGATCTASGAGALNTTATIPPGKSVTYTLQADVVAGTGPGAIGLTAHAATPGGTVDSFAFDNGAGDEDFVGDALSSVAFAVTGSGTGTLHSSPQGINCDLNCTPSLASGTTVTFHAVPAAGSVFTGWSGSTCTGIEPCTFTVGTGQTIAANFDLSPIAVTSPRFVTTVVGRPFRYFLTATGSSPVTLGAANLPSWLTFDPLTGLLSGTAPSAGAATVALSASDSNGTSTESLVITAGNAPVISSASTYAIAGAGDSWASIDVNATGDGTIQFSANALPGTVTFNSTSGVFSGNAGAVGVFNVPVIATNAFGADFKTIAISIGGAPVITSALSSTATVGSPFTYTLTATGTGPLTLAAGALPAWANFVPGTGIISGIPTRAGSFVIGLSASNGVGVSQQNLLLTVNGPAVITSALIAHGTEGQPFSYSLTAEGTAPLSRSIIGIPDWLTFDASTGVLSGLPPAPGSFTMSMTATNALGADTQTLTVNIAAVAPSPTAPVITSALTASAAVGRPFTYAISARGQVPMTFSAAGLPAWANIDVATGLITGTPNSTGHFTLTLGASNTLGNDSRIITLDVYEPTLITSPLTADAVVGDAFSYTVTGSGSAPLTFTASGLPAWATFDALTGTLSGIPTAEGVVTISIGVSNPGSTDTKALVITVRARPVITSSLAVSAIVGQFLSYTLTASGTAPLTLGVAGLPSWANFNSSTGVISGIPDSEGETIVTLSVTNALGATSEQLTLTARIAPTLLSSLSETAFVGTPFTYTMVANGTAPLTFTATGLPAWASFDALTGTLSGTPTTAGNFPITLGVSNLAGSDSKVLVITVPGLPVVTSALSAAAVVGDAFSYTMTALGDGPLTFATGTLPDWLSFDANTGILSGIPTLEGPVSITLTVTSSAGSTNATLVITVRTRPVIINALSMLGAVGLPFTLPLSASGTQPITFGATSLPPGLAVNGNAITGTPTVAGNYTVTETATNAAGTDTVTVLIDIRPVLPAPVFTLPEAEAILTATQVSFAGTVNENEVGNLVRLAEGGTHLCDAPVQSGGVWECTVTLSEGAHTVSAVVVDANGFTGTQADSRHFFIDLTSPSEPTLVSPVPESATNDAQPPLLGTGEAGATLTISLDGQILCSTVVQSDGRWSCLPNTSLPEGEVILLIGQRDAAGHDSMGAAIRLTIDTIAPAPPTLQSPEDDSTLTKSTFPFSGTAEPKSTVHVSVDGAEVCSDIADDDGLFGCTPGAPIANGMHSVTLVSSDAAGNLSTEVMSTLRVDATAPLAPTITAPVGRINSNTPAYSGTAETGSTVIVSLDGQPLCETTADPQGNWYCPQTASVLTEGMHLLVVTATDAAGNISVHTTGNFSVETAIGTLEVPSGASTTENIRLQGQGTPGAQVVIYVDGASVGSVVADENGHWEFDVPLLPEGEHRLAIGITGSTGQEVFRSREVVVSVERPEMSFRGGLGCSSTGQTPLGAMVLLAALFFCWRRKGVAPALLATTLIATQASAQMVVRDFELEQFWLNPSARGGLVVGGADLLQSGDARVAVSLGYQHAPLKYFEEGKFRATLIDHRFTASISAAGSVLPWLELGATLPVMVFQSGGAVLSRTGETVLAAIPRGASIGTPWLQARIGLLQERNNAPIDLGVTFMLGLPVGNARSLTTDRGISGQVIAGIGHTAGSIRLAAEVGASLRPQTALVAGSNEVMGSRLLANVGLSTIGAALRGEISLRSFISLEKQPAGAELLVGVRYAIGDWELFGLAGPGFGNAPGTPVLRAVLGVSLGGVESARCGGRPPATVECPRLDFDDDGVPNGIDSCPEIPGQGSSDGCPAPVISIAMANLNGISLPAPIQISPVEEEEELVQPVKLVIVELKADRIEIREKIYFETGKAAVLPRSYPLLNEVAALMKAHPEVKRVSVDGHTDNRGSDAFNLRLSDLRAQSVRAYLVSVGVEPERLTARGFGLTQPIAPNSTAEGREKNRRVEFLLLE